MDSQKAATKLSIEQRIVMLRGEKVIIDSDLASLYRVETRQLNQAIKRNLRRFPPDFAFQLTPGEYQNLRSQIVISSSEYGGRRYAPWVFTEHGAIMAATVLNSATAIEMSIYVVRAVVRLRELAGAHAFLAAKLAELEKRVTAHDTELREIIATVRALLMPERKPRRRIGYST